MYGLLKAPVSVLSGTGTRAHTPGRAPGIESLLEEDTGADTAPVHIHCIDYGPDHLERFDVDDVDAFLARERPEGAEMRWISVVGLRPRMVDTFRRRFGFHTLASEDTLNIPQRPKLDDYGDHLYSVIRMLELTRDEQLDSQQVSIFCKPGLVVSFHERDSVVWEPIVERICKPESRFRQLGASYLLYALLDAVVDYCFPILEHFAEEMEELESLALVDDDEDILGRLYAIKRELVALRRLVWPMREIAEALRRSESPIVSEQVRDFSRDLLDHCLQLIDIVESLRESTSSLTDLHLSIVSNRMNEVMKVLTVMASLFIPVTFFAGVYGMNFKYFPELDWRWAYPTFWGICLAITIALLIYFRRKKWI